MGFGKRFGADMMWSRTGAAYSGREIPHAVQVRALPLRTLSGAPIFHGDVVSPPGEEVERFLVLGTDDEILFARARSSKLIPRGRSTLARRRDFVRHGNVLESVHLSRMFDAALRAHAAREFPSAALSWSLAAATFLGCAAAGALQAGFQGGAGAIVPCLGGIAVGWGAFFAWKWRFAGSFRRSTTRRVADGAVWRTALLFSGAYGAAALLELPGVAVSLGGALVGMFAASVLGSFVALVSGVLAADTLTRHRDGTLGLDSEVRSFLELPGPFVRVRPDPGDR